MIPYGAAAVAALASAKKGNLMKKHDRRPVRGFWDWLWTGHWDGGEDTGGTRG